MKISMGKPTAVAGVLKITMAAPKKPRSITEEARASSTLAGKSSIWGGIILLPSNEEVDWGGQSFEKGLAPLAAMKGTKYGTDWKWSGDLSPDECDIAVRMNGKVYDFAGPEAVKKLLDLAKKEGAIKAAAIAGEAEADNSKMPKTSYVIRSLNPTDFGVEWNKEEDTVKIWAKGSPRDIPFRVVGQLDKAIKDDTGAKHVRVLPGTSYTPQALTLNGKLVS